MGMADELYLDSILLTVENPIRRKLIRRLSEEPSYQLQLSKELGFSQQLVAKHLGAMEDAGFVSSVHEESPHGPQRKEYLLNKSVSLSIDFAPNLFRARVMSFDSIPDASDIGHPADRLIPKINALLSRPEESGKVGSLGTLVKEIDRRLGSLEDERSVLLYLRHLAMKEVARAIGGMRISPDKKKVLYHVLNEHDADADAISRSLNLKEELVRETLAEINRELQV